MKKWIAIFAAGSIGFLLLGGGWIIYAVLFRLPQEYYVLGEMQQIGVSADIFFHDHEDRQDVYLTEMPWLELSSIFPQDIVQPISRNLDADPGYPNVIHKEYGTMRDLQIELDKRGLRE